MAIANGTCVSFCNQPNNSATSGESRRYVITFTRFAGGGIWLPQESLRNILASPGTPLGQSRYILHGWKEDTILVKRIATCTHLSSTVSQ